VLNLLPKFYFKLHLVSQNYFYTFLCTLFTGARVIFACRDELKATSAMEIIRQQLPNADLVYRQLDLSSFNSIRMFADAIVKSKIVINKLC
jgi:NAD(P)-dependent dehydrogenase (short-subunit alcohol dehydrogenase family)